MTGTIKSLTKGLVRLAVVWVVGAIALAATSWLMPGLSFQAVDGTSRWLVIVSAALLLAIVNLLIRPIVLLIARPLGWILLFVVGFLINAIALWITAWLLPGFEVSFLAGLFGGIIIAFFSAVITGILDLDEDGSWYQNRIERLAREDPFDSADEPGKGLMMVEIDGLSYWHIHKALDEGLLPNLSRMMKENGYQLSLTDCGLPSMTSSCQAGIMFGDNHDIPAYRWYDKSKQKLYVSADDATELNARYAHGHGLMRRGSSVMNMFNGDAEKSMFTMANMFEADEEERKRRAHDVTLLMLNPYFLARALAVFFVDLARELWEAWQQKRKNVWPRLNRMEHWYPFVRAAMSGLMRDMSANIAILDMMRGAPSIYMLYLGYDEVAHHSGPWTNDAFGDLKRFDGVLGRLYRFTQSGKTPRPYDLIVLSDHGQSFGATFKQRYGLTIKEFIEQQLPVGTTVSQAIGGDTGAIGLSAMAGELSNVSQTGDGNAFDRTVASQGQKLAEHSVKAADEVEAEEKAAVTAYGSGNAAQVYFDLFDRKIKLSELEAAYPGMVDAIVAHEGIGLVVGYTDDGDSIALGKGGSHNLVTDEVVGEDPILPYAQETGHGAATVEKRVWQLRRVMEFPSAGDLWLISTIYEDGTVAALEELIGSHGGVGGEQTDAFIFHPPDLEVPETRNSIDVFHILNGHRDAPVVEREKDEDQPEPVADWAIPTLKEGIGQTSTWIGRAVRCLFLERDAYAEVVRDPYMTGPALLIFLVAVTLNAITISRSFDFWFILGSLAAWVVAILGLTGAGWLLTHTGNFTKTFRAVSFALTVFVLSILAFIPFLSGAIHMVVIILGFIAIWMATAVAHKTSGWRTLVLPVIAFLIVILSAALIRVFGKGISFTVKGVLESLGITPPAL